MRTRQGITVQTSRRMGCTIASVSLSCFSPLFSLAWRHPARLRRRVSACLVQHGGGGQSSRLPVESERRAAESTTAPGATLFPPPGIGHERTPSAAGQMTGAKRSSGPAADDFLRTTRRTDSTPRSRRIQSTRILRKLARTQQQHCSWWGGGLEQIRTSGGRGRVSAARLLFPTCIAT
jgi:hypothetical protein